MKRSTALVLCCALALPGCKTTSQANPYEPMALADGKGAVVFTIDRHGRAVDRPFAVHAVRYDPQTGRLLGDSDDGGQGFVAVYSTKPEIGRNAKHWAFELEPGSYAISSIDRVGVASQPTFSGGSLAVLLIATVIATAASHAIAAAEHASREFVQDGVVGRETPTFTVAAGQVTHIGDFAFDSESRTVERPVATESQWSGPNATGLQATSLQPVTEMRTLVAYSFDPGAVDQYLRIRRLDRYPLSHQRLQPLIGRRLVLEDYPGESPDNRAPVDGPRALPATYAPAAPWPAPSAGPLPAQRPASGAALSQLQERFLDGEITKEEYERERKRLAAGS